jgi:hypothetical protein
LPTVLKALAGENTYGIIPNSAAVEAFAGRVTLDTVPPSFYTPELTSEEGNAWATKQYSAFVSNPKFTVWNPLVTALSGDITRLYYNLINDKKTSSGSLIINFVRYFSIHVITNWIGGAVQSVVPDPKSQYPPDLQPASTIPLDIFQGISKNIQKEPFEAIGLTNITMKERNRAQKYNLLAERDELFDSWGVQRKTRTSDFDALTELPADAADITPKKLRRLMREFAPRSKATGKLAMLNALIDANAITKDNAVNDALNQFDGLDLFQVDDMKEVEAERGGEEEKE